MLVMAAFLVLSPLFGQMGPLAVFVALLQQGAFNILFFIIVARAMAVRRADAMGLFCVSWGMMTAGQLAGWAVAGPFGALLFAMPNAGMAAALVSVALVSVAYMFALPEAKLSELMGIGTDGVRGEDGAGLEPGEFLQYLVCCRVNSAGSSRVVHMTRYNDFGKY